MTIPARISKVNWLNANSVKNFADRLGPGMTVYKHPRRYNYNICHTENEERLGIDPEWVVYRSGNGNAKKR